jgi:putative flippase GtrA
LGLAFAVNYAAFYFFYDSPAASILPGKDSEANLGFVTHPDSRLLVASILAVEAAIVFKFFVHERWTFRREPRTGWIGGRLVQFNISSALAAAIPIATINVLSAAMGVSPYVAMFAGVMIGFGLNWLWSAHRIWPKAAIRPEKSN